MIGRLRGVLLERSMDGVCLIDVGGVGYEVTVPTGAVGHLPLGEEQVTLHIHTHVREDAFLLYGFASAEDRAAFRAVLGVSGVGPKIALSILGTLDASALSTAISLGDTNVFKGISGVGKKTAERLILELKDKLPTVVAVSGAAPSSSVMASPVASRVTDALVQMGYKSTQAEQAVAQVNNAEDMKVEELLRNALAQLG